jgi:hypothetical protein
MYHYYAHGLAITSELACPELVATRPNGHAPDVTIRLGETPGALTTPTSQSVLYQAKPNQFLLTIPHIARFWVQEGKQITIEPMAGSHEDAIRLFLLGSALGALLHQRGRVILHGSAVATAYGAMVFVGLSGAGKSTLAAALQQRGYRVLTDDVCSIVYDQATQTAQVQPGLAHLKLWADAAKELALTDQATRRVRPELEKYALPLHHTFDLAPVRLDTVYQLQPTNGSAWQIEVLSTMPKMQALIMNTYRQRFLQGLGTRPQQLQQLSQIAGQVRFCRVTRPSSGFQLPELVERLVTDWTRS